MNPNTRNVIIAFSFMALFLVIAIYTWFELDSSVDFNILHNLIMTNQTFVDSMNCETIIITKNALDVTLSPTQQDEVNQLKIDFKRLYEEKECKP